MKRICIVHLMGLVMAVYLHVKRMVDLDRHQGETKEVVEGTAKVNQALMSIFLFFKKIP